MFFYQNNPVFMFFQTLQLSESFVNLCQSYGLQNVASLGLRSLYFLRRGQLLVGMGAMQIPEIGIYILVVIRFIIL